MQQETGRRFDLYEQQVEREMQSWIRKVNRKSTLGNQLAKSAQTKINEMIPEKIHQAITTTVKQMVRGVLYGASYTAPDIAQDLSFQERENLVLQRIEFYKRTAAAEGGITGMGGIISGIADFPLLLGIKLKLLFDIAAFYGYPVKDFKERLYMLYIFQLAFSSQTHRKLVFSQIENWDQFAATLPDDINQFDWRTFQLEYRDHIDLAKMAQLVPVIGAVVGLVVNYRLVRKLGDTAMNCYRMRYFKK